MSVTIHGDMFEAASLYGEDEGPKLMWALVDFGENGIMPDPSERWYPTFVALKDRIRLSSEAHDKGRKMARARWSKDKHDAGEQTSMMHEHDADDDASMMHEHMHKHDAEMSRDEKRGVEKRRDKGAKFTPPTTEDVEAYCEEWGHMIDAGAFVDFYASKGWKVGSAPMKDWKAAVRNWWRTDHKRGQDPLNDKPGKYAKFGV